MYCTVYTNGNGSIIYINPNCNMKLIYEYLRVVTEVPDSKEIDLCTESGRLLGIYEAPCCAKGLQYFKTRSNYFVMTFDYVDGSDLLYNPQPLMHYTNRDFEGVFTRIKKTFGIPTTEPIDDDDALLIFEHLLQAYQENPRQFSESNVSSPSKKSDKKKRSQSSTSVKGKSSKQMVECSVLAQWREEKRTKMATYRMEESEANMLKRKSSVRSSLSNIECRIGETAKHEWEEASPEEQTTEPVDPKKTKGGAQTTGKKGPKKQHKKAGKDAKEDAKLQQAAAPSRSGVLPSPKSSCKVLPTESALQIRPSVSTSGEELRTICFSKSSLFAKSDVHDPVESTLSRPHIYSIRQFFKDNPTDLMVDLPKPPAGGSKLDFSCGPTKTKKSQKLAGTKRKKVVISRRSHRTKIRRDQQRK